MQSVTPFRTQHCSGLDVFSQIEFHLPQISYRPATLVDLFDELQDSKIPVELIKYLKRFCTCIDMECDTV